MGSNRIQPLPEWLIRAYAAVRSRAEEQPSGLTREEACSLLVEDDDVSLEGGDARYAVDRLLSTGWLYECGGAIRVTDPEQDPPCIE